MIIKQIGTQTGWSIGGVSSNVGSPHINNTMNNHTDNNKKPINFFIMIYFFEKVLYSPQKYGQIVLNVMYSNF